MSTNVFVRYPRLAINRLGLWLFILSEATVFVALLWARFFLLGTETSPELDQIIGLVITSLLLLSSLTAYRAEASIAAGDSRGLVRNIMLTLILGVIFVIGVGIEWSQALSHFPPNTPFGTVFFSMTGMHAFHVLTGLLMLTLLYINARQGRYSQEQHWGVEAVIKYWHFVDVVWVFFYPAIYLVG